MEAGSGDAWRVKSILKRLTRDIPEKGRRKVREKRKWEEGRRGKNNTRQGEAKEKDKDRANKREK